jgi:excisionase family DNA binding protein
MSWRSGADQSVLEPRFLNPIVLPTDTCYCVTCDICVDEERGLVETVTATDVGPADLAAIDTVLMTLPSDSPVAALLHEVCRLVRGGSDVMVAGQSDHLTPAQAARLLRMSRTHLYKVMDAGQLPFVRVGRDRRIAADDLFIFRAQREQDRRALAERFAHSADTRAQALAEMIEQS